VKQRNILLTFGMVAAMTLFLGGSLGLLSQQAEAASHDYPTHAPKAGDANVPKGNHVTITTKYGDIVMELYPDSAPDTVANFKVLAASGFYDGLTFHRVVPGFVVQGGDPEGTGRGGPGYTIHSEFNIHKHITGSLAMARKPDPDSAGSQFYIALAPQPSLDGKYTVFGQVIKGMDVVNKIKKGDVMIHVSVVKDAAK
jgi:peptidylprolyl isomerase/peptidyl-prolyl cis-trans isomerase B (cyclophilin B)